MTTRVTTGLRVVELVASRPDPTDPMPVGALAAALSASLSTTSRLCTELEGLGLLERGERYGSYRIGPAAIQLSGQAAAPYARAVRFALTRAAQETGETVCLAAPCSDGLRTVSLVDSPWTLHAPARLGEVADERSAISIAAQGRGAHVAGAGAGAGAGASASVEVTTGKRIELAVPVLDPLGQTVAVVAVRLPVYRRKRGIPLARRALAAARRTLERALAAQGGEQPRTPPFADRSPTSLAAAVRILRHLATGVDSLAGIARATGLRLDRTRRLVGSCRRSGLVTVDHDGIGHRLSWSVHGWFRATVAPTLAQHGRPFVAQTARLTGACAFLTVLKGMRSLTLVEELAVLGEGLSMRPWLGRPHPIVGSDGGPTLLMDLPPEQLAVIFPSRHTPQDLAQFLDRVRQVVRDGVLVLESVEEFGITSVSAPVRDASGMVAAAACVVGATEYVRPRLAAIEDATLLLAGRVSGLLT